MRDFFGYFLVESIYCAIFAHNYEISGLKHPHDKKLKNLLSRLGQSFSALLGTNMVISAVSVPVYHALTEDYTGDGEINRTVLNATLLIVFWNLAVMSLILKRALNINTILAAMISFNYFMVYQFLVIWLIQ